VGGRAPIGLHLLPPGLFNPTDLIPARALIEWLASHLAAARQPTPPDYTSLAPVVITTFAGAAQQPWDRLIFLDSNEHIWPAPILENPLLPDSTRSRLNRNRHQSPILLTTHDLRALDQARFLDLIEHCRHPITFAGVLLDHTDSGDHVQPNEWVVRSLIETAPEDTFPPDLWTAGAQTFPPDPPPALDPAERAHLETVHSARHNGTMPFDRYQFNFHETRLEPSPWSATSLDEAVTCPATFALRELFNAQSTATWTPTRQEATAVGTRAHRWLGQILGTRAPHKSHESHSSHKSHLSPELALPRELTTARAELQEWYAAENLPLPLWWETCLRKTAWATRRCLLEVLESVNGRYCFTEQKLAVAVRTPSGPLPLKGRIDILISDRPEIPNASVRMFDFKTGRGQAPTLSTLARGSGAQFAAYYLMARDAGAAEAVIGIIKPGERALDVFSAADEPALRAHFALLAELWRNLRFGRRGPLVDDYGVCETLPLATVPIDPAILDQKAALFLLAS
jgi:hypothetical protein